MYQPRSPNRQGPITRHRATSSTHAKPTHLAAIFIQHLCPLPFRRLLRHPTPRRRRPIRVPRRAKRSGYRHTARRSARLPQRREHARLLRDELVDFGAGRGRVRLGARVDLSRQGCDAPHVRARLWGLAPGLDGVETRTMLAV